MKIQTIPLYQEKSQVTLTTYILDDSPEMLKGKKRPAVLICPGGAYMFCSDREAEPIALRFAAMGYHAFILRYSVYSNSGVKFPVPGKTDVYEDGVAPSPMREIGRAILEIRNHADEWLVDTEKIILTGYSAGANNCALYCVYWDKPVICDYFKEKPEMFRPAAAILGYGVYDYQAMKDTLEKLGDRGRIEMNKGFNYAFFGETEPEQERLDEYSPAKLVSENTPPMFLWATREDNVVPVNQTTIMSTALAGQDIPFEVHIFENGQHGLSLADQATAEAMEQVHPDVAVWMELAGTWLKKRFALELPEQCARWEPPKDTEI